MVNIMATFEGTGVSFNEGVSLEGVDTTSLLEGVLDSALDFSVCRGSGGESSPTSAQIILPVSPSITSPLACSTAISVNCQIRD